MSYNGILTIGSAGIMSYQNALNVTGQNIENAYTDGYSRKVVNFSELGTGGVDISEIKRMYNEHATRELRSNVSTNSHFATYSEYAKYLGDYFYNDNSSLEQGIQKFYDALNGVINSPASITSRQVFLDQTGSLVDRFQDLSKTINEQFDQINLEVNSNINMVNQLANSIADYNKQIQATAGSDPSLFDARDAVLKQLSEYISTQTYQHSDGTIDVYIGNKDSLVYGANARQLTTVVNQTDAGKLDLALVTEYNTAPIESKIFGGTLGGLMSFRSEVLEPAQNELDRIAITMSDIVNQQHKQGLDLNNSYGNNFFNDVNSSYAIGSRVFESINNSGSGAFTVSITDVQQLQASDYKLSFTSATDYELVRNSDGVQVSSGTISGFPEQISVDGFQLNITSGSFTAGDYFRVSPTHNGSKDFNTNITNVSDIAIASPLRISSENNNSGTGSIELGAITDITNASFATPNQLSPPIKIEFLSTTSYQLVNADTSAVIEGPIAYDPTTKNSVFPTPGSFEPGYQVTLSGSIDANDVFNISFNDNAPGDNRNALLLANLQTDKIMQGGTISIENNYNRYTSKLASTAHNAELSSQASNVLLEQSQARRDALSGVNLDEEAANLLRFQQAYQASAQLVSLSTTLFETLISAFN